MFKSDGFFKIIFTIFILIMLPLKSLLAENVLYCSGEIATGFVKQNNVYKEGLLNTHRYTVKVLGDFEGIKIHLITCYHQTATTSDGTKVEIPGLPYVFLYNKRDRRFLYFQASSGGYIDNEADDTDSFEGGKCQNF
jgi:hypothetical protein